MLISAQLNKNKEVVGENSNVESTMLNNLTAATDQPFLISQHRNIFHFKLYLCTFLNIQKLSEKPHISDYATSGEPRSNSLIPLSISLQI